MSGLEDKSHLLLNTLLLASLFDRKHKRPGRVRVRILSGVLIHVIDTGMGYLAKSFMQASAPRTESRAACSTGKHFYSPQLKPYHSSINTFSCSKRARNTVPSSETPH
ncbi:Uncharacterized protein HZ326_18853 [Fusarium oxysporum f. sp. albedinis]|nr:Uncharacterized protein HZ326_18853 [Fusarium oxysporum f. sp. albedinis]